MNMKKTLAGLMAGVVAISAMATVAVSAKAQEAKTKTWTTSWTEKTKAASTVATVQVVVKPSSDTTEAWAAGNTLKIIDNNADQVALDGIKIKSIKRIENRAEGSAEKITEDLGLYVKIQKNGDDNTDTLEFTGIVPNTTGAPLALILEVEADKDIPNSAFSTNLTSTVNATVSSISNAEASVEEETKEVGIKINEDRADDTVIVTGDIAYTYDLDAAIRAQGRDAFLRDNENTLAGKLMVSEPTEELMDYMLDAKGAEITFNFLTKEYKEDSDVDTFNPWADRYDWDASEMKSAISLRVNNSNVLSVAMKDFDKEKFAATYSWDEVVAKFQGGSYTGLVHTLGLKVDNSKLPKDKDGKVIALELKSITVKVPEMAETEDDTMVEDIVKDFAAGESATVVEDTLPAASDAPAATDAPATTDAAANPETGNSAAALLAIPAALAAAAIVAKKRG